MGAGRWALRGRAPRHQHGPGEPVDRELADRAGLTELEPRPMRTRHPRPWSVAGILLAAVLPVGCGTDDDSRSSASAPLVLTVSAASSLREVMIELGGRFQAEHPGLEVRFNVGSSGALEQQIMQGAPVDVFVAASDRHLDSLGRHGRVIAVSRRILAHNRLVLAVPAEAGSGPVIAGFADLARPEVRRAAIGDTISVPAGEYAVAALRSLGVWAAVAPKAVYGGNARQVLAYVQGGNVDAGLVYRTDALGSPRVRIVAEAPPGSHPPITYTLAALRGNRAPRAARTFVDFLVSPAAKAVLRRRGFDVPR